ncbi:unnamed protein product [Notodromas monacha]|uniref:F-box domain-containing protein n=1 Tax=Notodromas monacha TaxID=399045 RepID=A0A7R9G9Q7_9CRUS|nr:unnamed protein product [Notodromas monacha]CAG0914483.1 unnamed protein product [Notodromas monacha]
MLRIISDRCVIVNESVNFSVEKRCSNMDLNAGLEDLPDEMLVKILSSLNYGQLACCRMVCRKFNAVCGELLSAGFIAVEAEKNRISKELRLRTPRRFSDRKCHSLSKHIEILASLDTRISLLHMTYSRYIDSKQCPFVPGKVLDEIFRVLKVVSKFSPIPWDSEMLKELRDLSSMAIEHFDEFIAPQFKGKIRSIMPIGLCNVVYPTSVLGSLQVSLSRTPKKQVGTFNPLDGFGVKPKTYLGTSTRKTSHPGYGSDFRNLTAEETVRNRMLLIDPDEYWELYSQIQSLALTIPKLKKQICKLTCELKSKPSNSPPVGDLERVLAQQEQQLDMLERLTIIQTEHDEICCAVEVENGSVESGAVIDKCDVKITKKCMKRTRQKNDPATIDRAGPSKRCRRKN